MSKTRRTIESFGDVSLVVTMYGDTDLLEMPSMLLQGSVLKADRPFVVRGLVSALVAKGWTIAVMSDCIGRLAASEALRMGGRVIAVYEKVDASLDQIETLDKDHLRIYVNDMVGRCSRIDYENRNKVLATICRMYIPLGCNSQSVLQLKHYFSALGKPIIDITDEASTSLLW